MSDHGLKDLIATRLLSESVNMTCWCAYELSMKFRAFRMATSSAVNTEAFSGNAVSLMVLPLRNAQPTPAADFDPSVYVAT